MLSNHSSSEAVLTRILSPASRVSLHVHLARHAVLDRDDVRQFGDARAQLRAHQVAGVRMAPQRDADVDLLADVAVVLVAASRPARAGSAAPARARRCSRAPIAWAWRASSMHDVHVLVRAGHDGPAVPPISSTAISNRALALGERHREELALLAGDEHAVDRRDRRPSAAGCGASPPRRSRDRAGTASAPPPRGPSSWRGRRLWHRVG